MEKLTTMVAVIATVLGFWAVRANAVQCGWNGKTLKSECSCAGDNDCNNMFTNFCKDSGAASCDTGKDTCTCDMKLVATGGGASSGTTGTVKGGIRAPLSRDRLQYQATPSPGQVPAPSAPLTPRDPARLPAAPR